MRYANPSRDRHDRKIPGFKRALLPLPGDVLAYHRMATGLPFVRAAQDLGAWVVKP